MLSAVGCWSTEVPVCELAVRVLMPPSQATPECSGHKRYWHHVALSHTWGPPWFQYWDSLG